jgi:hypothetical protein
MLLMLHLQASRSSNMALSPTSMRNALAKHKRERDRETSPTRRAEMDAEFRGRAKGCGVYSRKVALALNTLGLDAGVVAGAGVGVWERGITTEHIEQHMQASGQLW